MELRHDKAERGSPLGFGCGSVLGRVGRRDSLRAMGAAWDAGIRIFDTARSYGFGEAEAVLGEFLAGKRDEAVIATKYGLAPERPGALKRAVVPVVRAAMQLPGVRGLLHRGGGEPHEQTRGAFSVAGLWASVEQSLRQLRTDRLDVLFLHEAPASVMRDDALMTELEAIVQTGKVLRVGLYCTAQVAAHAVANAPAVLKAVQFGANAFDPATAQIVAGNPRAMMLVENHPFGSEARVARVKAVLDAMRGDTMVAPELREKLNNGGWPMLTEAIFGMILGGSGARSGADALVLSMMQPEHIAANVRAVQRNRFNAGELAQMRARMLATARASAS